MNAPLEVRTGGPINYFVPRYQSIHLYDMFTPIINRGLTSSRGHVPIEQSLQLQRRPRHFVRNVREMNMDTQEEVSIPLQSVFETDVNQTVGKSPLELVTEAKFVFQKLLNGDSPDGESFSKMLLSAFDEEIESSVFAQELVQKSLAKSMQKLIKKFALYRQDLVPALAASFVVGGEAGMQLITDIELKLHVFVDRILAGKKFDSTHGYISPRQTFKVLHNSQTGEPVLDQVLNTANQDSTYAGICPYAPAAISLEQHILLALETLQSRFNQKDGNKFSKLILFPYWEMESGHKSRYLGTIAKETAIQEYFKLKQQYLSI